MFCKFFSFFQENLFQHSGDENGEEIPKEIEKLEFRKSDVIGEALNAVIANDTEARRSLMDKFTSTYMMFPVLLRKSDINFIKH